jgi:phosphomevalonate kinase
VIIGITGLRKSGKTTAANYIKQYNSKFIRVAFADCLKEEVAQQYKIPVEDLYDNYKKEQYRKLLQDHGAMRRKEDPNYWVYRCRHIFADHTKLCVIEDVRFLNEIAALREFNAKFLRIKASDKVRRSRGWVYDSLIDQHPSEIELLDISDNNFMIANGIIIKNEDGLETFRNRLFQALVQWEVTCEVYPAME